MSQNIFPTELRTTKLLFMNKNIMLTSMITCLLLMTTYVAFSQDNAKQKKQESAATKATIEKVVPNLAHHTVSVAVANIDVNEDYHLLLYNSGKELINTYWVDGNDLT